MTTTGVTRFPAQSPTGTINGVHLYDVVDKDELTAALAANHVREIADGINTAVAREARRLGAVFQHVVEKMPPGWSTELLPADRQARATFAKVAAKHPDSWALFALLDGRNILPELLKRADPGPFLTPTGRTYTEENA